MNAKEALDNIIGAVQKSLKIKLDYGETCPCCGHKKQAKRMATPQMIAANRRNQKKAVEAIRKK